MPFLEIITPDIKTDPVSREKFVSNFPLLARDYVHKGGMIEGFTGFMVQENGKDVSSDYKFVIALEWPTVEIFSQFVASAPFGEFVGHLIPLLASPPGPQLYNTELRPRDVLSSPFSEILRLKISDESKIAEAQDAFKLFIAAIMSKKGSTKAETGLSQNLDEKILIGVVGWEDLNIRSQVMADVEVAKAKAVLMGFGEVETFVASFSPVQYP